MPLAKQPMDDFPFLVHHKALHLVHVRAPVVSLEETRSISYRHLSRQDTTRVHVTWPRGYPASASRGDYVS